MGRQHRRSMQSDLFGDLSRWQQIIICMDCCRSDLVAAELLMWRRPEKVGLFGLEVRKDGLPTS